jgi:hypothetical protein
MIIILYHIVPFVNANLSFLFYIAAITITGWPSVTGGQWANVPDVVFQYWVGITLNVAGALL